MCKSKLMCTPYLVMSSGIRTPFTIFSSFFLSMLIDFSFSHFSLKSLYTTGVDGAYGLSVSVINPRGDETRYFVAVYVYFLRQATPTT